MKLAELRKLSIRKQIRIRFQLRNGMECVISEHGVAQVPALQGIPDFNLEEEVAMAGEFLLEPAALPDKKSERKNPPKPRSVTSAELAGMTASSSSAGPAPDHDDE